MNEFIIENIEFIISIASAIIAVIYGALRTQKYFHKQKIERITEQHKVALDKITAKHEREKDEISDKARGDIRKLQVELEEEYESKKNQLNDKEDEPLIQEVKMVYVKYLHIRRSSEKAVYQKYINRLEKNIDVNSEYHYYRFNKYNRSDNSITITDRSSGVVDQNILYPWKKLTFTDKPSQKIEGMIAQDVDNRNVYFSATTYYNGFKEDNEDIGMKMEMNTQCARLIADFSSVVGLERLFTREPDAYKIERDGRKVKLLGLEKIGLGIYHLEANNLKKGESLLLDFHVNWDYLNDTEQVDFETVLK